MRLMYRCAKVVSCILFLFLNSVAFIIILNDFREHYTVTNFNEIAMETFKNITIIQISNHFIYYNT